MRHAHSAPSRLGVFPPRESPPCLLCARGAAAARRGQECGPQGRAGGSAGAQLPRTWCPDRGTRAALRRQRARVRPRPEIGTGARPLHRRGFPSSLFPNGRSGSGATAELRGRSRSSSPGPQQPPSVTGRCHGLGEGSAPRLPPSGSPSGSRAPLSAGRGTDPAPSSPGPVQRLQPVDPIYTPRCPQAPTSARGPHPRTPPLSLLLCSASKVL